MCLCVCVRTHTESIIIVVFLNPPGNIKSRNRARDVFLGSTLRVKNILFSIPKEPYPGGHLLLRRKQKILLIGTTLNATPGICPHSLTQPEKDFCARPGESGVKTFKPD